MAFTPGPNNIMIMASGLNHGVRASLPHLVGIGLGVPSMFLALGLGLALVFERYPQVHTVIKVVGALYLIYLAWQIAHTAAVESRKRPVKPFTLVQTVLFQWMNPKSWVVGTTAIATFTTVGEGLLGQVLIIALAFMVMAFLSAGTWLLFGVSLQVWLKKPLYRHIFNVSMAIILVVSVLPVTLQMLFYLP